MSTKATIAYDCNFHLYHEAFDEDYVYLGLEGAKFEASYNRVMVPIPVHVWEVIRPYPGIDLKYADKTDARNQLSQRKLVAQLRNPATSPRGGNRIHKIRQRFDHLPDFPRMFQPISRSHVSVAVIPDYVS
jgi:hypothetical protein